MQGVLTNFRGRHSISRAMIQEAGARVLRSMSTVLLPVAGLTKDDPEIKPATPVAWRPASPRRQPCRCQPCGCQPCGCQPCGRQPCGCQPCGCQPCGRQPCGCHVGQRGRGVGRGLTRTADAEGSPGRSASCRSYFRPVPQQPGVVSELDHSPNTSTKRQRVNSKAAEDSLAAASCWYELSCMVTS